MKLVKFVDFGPQKVRIPVIFLIEEWLWCIMRGTELGRFLCAWQVRILISQFTTYFYFFNPARIRRDGVKEDYYV